MTGFHLIRHGQATVPETVLAGRSPGYELSEQGRQQVQQLVPILGAEGLDALYFSPLERTRETATILGQQLGIDIHVAEPLLELDFGHWSGRSFRQLDEDPRWAHFNTFRSATQMPGGEWMAEVQLRATKWMCELRDRQPDSAVAAVTHGDVIRAVLAYFAGMPLDLMQRFRIDPASLTSIQLDRDRLVISRVNWTP